MFKAILRKADGRELYKEVPANKCRINVRVRKPSLCNHQGKNDLSKNHQDMLKPLGEKFCWYSIFMYSHSIADINCYGLQKEKNNLTNGKI